MEIVGKDGNVTEAYGLLDQVSEVTLIDQRAADELGLERFLRHNSILSIIVLSHRSELAKPDLILNVNKQNELYVKNFEKDLFQEKLIMEVFLFISILYRYQ